MDEVTADGWSWEENKLFEMALAVVDYAKPNRWETVAAMVGGNKSADDVFSHYVLLLKDLELIEAGKLDHKFTDCGTSYISEKEEDHKYLPLPLMQNLHLF
ncbi:Myb-like domain-containing protein [Heracleum sosnowskyi]|uniref:Myb-like domain-containing protein n=1 Tax=Heracleum sosnowskyi TaxID=360622 RepID=A0AAD8GUT6_9APIA|nr:Myb-like domain-containing protein [Heracleum sosnowskyi]